MKAVYLFVVLAILAIGGTADARLGQHRHAHHQARADAITHRWDKRDVRVVARHPVTVVQLKAVAPKAAAPKASSTKTK